MVSLYTGFKICHLINTLLCIHFIDQSFFEYPNIYYILMTNLSLQITSSTTLVSSTYTILGWKTLIYMKQMNEINSK